MLVLKTELTAGLSYTNHLAAVGLGVGMMVICVSYYFSAAVPYYGPAAVCCVSLPLLLLPLLVWSSLSIYIYICLLARVGVLCHRRSTALGHPCGMLPTGANIAVLSKKTWLAPDSTYT